MNKSIERIIPKPIQPGMVGDGFRVYNFIPRANISQRRMSPFLMLDFNAAFDFGPSETLRGVDIHPHKGFETVTIAYQGAVAHHDSTGNSGVIYPGDVQWRTAGAGILHKEYHEENFSKKGGPFEMVQLWVNLPKKDKSTPAHYQPITSGEMKKINLENDGGVVNVIAGEFNGQEGPAKTFTPVNLFDIKMNAGGKTSFSIPANHNTAILLINGNASINCEYAKEHSFILFENDGEEITIEAGQKAVLLVMSGEPIDEPIASYGPFVMNTQEEIMEAIQEFQQGKYGELV